MILIHGGPGGNHTLYADIEEDLFKISDIIEVDLRGCGLSAVPEDELEYCTLDSHIDDLSYLLDSINVANPIIVHGCSYGAIVALGCSIKYPDKISKMILSSCPVSSSFIESARLKLAHLGTKQQISVAEKLWNGTFENSEQFIEYYKIMAPLYIVNPGAASDPPTATNEIPYNIKLINIAFTTYLKNFNFVEKLQYVKAKTLIIAGKNDWITDEKHAITLHAGITKSSLFIIDNCGHFPWKDQKKLFLRFVKDFIDESKEN